MPRDKQARVGDDVARMAGAEDGPMLHLPDGNLGQIGRRLRKVGLARDPERWQGILAEQEEAIAIGAPGWWPGRDSRLGGRQAMPPPATGLDVAPPPEADSRPATAAAGAVSVGKAGQGIEQAPQAGAK